nr:Immunoglobulin-like and fibronectin type III domain-containing protein [Ipomoea batatas]
MAKGRKLTASRSEMLLGSYGYSNGHETGNEASELGEDDVWQTVEEMVNGDESFAEDGEWMPRAVPESNGGLGGFRSRRYGPRQQVGGLSLAFDDSGGKTGSSRIVHQFRGQQDGVAAAASPRGRHVAASAPVNVPDWSKIYRVNSVESLHDSDDAVDDNDEEMVPPHEYLAREYGVGRTLKGRDLSRVRDAVWSQTGFDG